MNRHIRIMAVFGMVLLSSASALATGCSGGRQVNASRSRTSNAGLYQVSYTPSVDPIPLRTMHSWSVQVLTRDGKPVDGATLQISGGMPDHGHGLPTQPFVREAQGGGRYLVDGMDFSMGGYWVVDIAIAAAPGSDTVRFELEL